MIVWVGKHWLKFVSTCIPKGEHILIAQILLERTQSLLAHIQRPEIGWCLGNRTQKLRVDKQLAWVEHGPPMCVAVLWFSRLLADAKCDILKNRTNFFEPDSFLISFELMTILPDLSDLVIEQVIIAHEVTVTVHAASPTASCPCCGTTSKRIQSRYTRTLRDLPGADVPLN